MYETYEQYLSDLVTKKRYRDLQSSLRSSSQAYLDFSTNDYLDLSKNEQVLKSSLIAAQKYGIGPTGSRLLSGNSPIHEEFEKKIAKDKHTESSLVFNSGFQANFSALSCLLNQNFYKTRPIVFFDKFNHSSLYQAIFVANPELCRYHHNDIEHLQKLLQKYENDHRPKFIVTETVFSMDGDTAPLQKIVELARNYNAFLYLDEAHATGLFGPNGYGLSTTIDMSDIPHLIMGTLSKAIGCTGGYVACHRTIRNFLINTAPGFIYSTAPSPAIIGGSLCAWEMVKELNEEREKLQNLGKTLREELKNLGFNTGTSTTHIVPIILEKEALCLKYKEALLEDHIVVSAIRPPTVPPNSARLRISLTAKHSFQDIERFIGSLKKCSL